MSQLMKYTVGEREAIGDFVDNNGEEMSVCLHRSSVNGTHIDYWVRKRWDFERICQGFVRCDWGQVKMIIQEVIRGYDRRDDSQNDYQD